MNAEVETEKERVDSRPELKTERLWLRPFQMSDASRVESLINDRVIAANTRSIPYPYPVGAAKEWIELQAESWLHGRAAVFAICVAESSELMGAIGLEIDENDQNAELGFWLGEDFRGQGYCTEAARAVVEFGLRVLGLNKIHAQHLARNPASGHVMRKIGMQREGLLKRHVRKWGLFEDVVVYGILASEVRDDSRPKKRDTGQL